MRAAHRCAELLARANAGDVLGPAPYAVERVNDEWRYRIAVKAIDTTAARRFIRDELPALGIDRDGVRLAVNADP